MSKAYLEKVFSSRRMKRFFDSYPGNEEKGIIHYQCNIQLSESFYPLLSVFEVALRNSLNWELTTMFSSNSWYSSVHLQPGLRNLAAEISRAQNQITKRLESITDDKVTAELTLGFWVRLMNAEYERILWKDLRRAFPYMPKHERQRHNVSAPLNKIRNFRNRVFHHEPICWNLDFIRQIHSEILKALNWINDDLEKWIQPLDRVPLVIADIEKQLR